MNNSKAQVKSVVRVIRGNRSFCRVVSSVVAVMFLSVTAAPTFAEATSVLGGNAVLTGMARATLDANGADAAVFSSSSASAVIDWSQFNIGSGQSMSFNGASTTFFNLVDGPKSQIDGIINGNGSVWVINPAGIAFGAGASVDVGGLFAAAAGNLENAAALRDGTATMPSFSSFAGEVDATKGTFVADQIALMGGKVSIGGEADFTGAFKVDVGAGENLIVDDIGGGMVSIDFSEFAEAANDVLDISGLDAEDALVDVVANGNVKATGDIQAGRLQLFAANDVDLEANVMTSMGNVEVASLKGDVRLAGAVEASGAVNIMAEGAARVEDAVYGQDGVSFMAYGGNVEIDGEVYAPISVEIYSSHGSTVIGKGATVGTTDEESGFITLSGDGVTSSGTIDVKRGTLEVYGNRGDINLYDKASGVVYAGDIVLVAEGNVYADNPNNKIGKVTKAEAGPGKILRINLGGGGDDFETVEIGNIISDTAYLRSEKGTIKVIGDITAPDQVVLETEEGDIIVMEDCTVTATGGGAVVKLNAGRNIVSEGNLVADGGVELTAKNDISVSNADGITLNGAVSENGSVSVSTKNGDIVIAPEAMVSATGEGGSVILRAGTVETGEGSVLVGENATLEAQDTILAIAGYGKLKASGVLEGEDIPALKSALQAANHLLANSSASIVEIGDRAMVIAGRLIALEGKVSVISSGTINAANAKLEVAAHEGGINLYTPTEDRAGAGKVIAGQADFVVNGDGDINVNNGDNAIDALGRVKADARADIEINLGDSNGGEVVTIGQNEVDENFGFVRGEGTMLIVGDITCPDMVYFQSVSGDVIAMEGSTVKVVDEGYGAYLMVTAGRSVRIDGTLDSDGGVVVDSAGSSGGITVGESGEVRAGVGSAAALQAAGFVQIDGTVASKGEIDIDAGGDVTVGAGGLVSADYWTYVGAYDLIGGDVQIDGQVNTRGLGVYAIGSVGTGEGAEVVASEVDLKSYGGGMALEGKLTADIADIYASGDIELGDMTINQRYEFSPGKFVSLGVVSGQGKITVREGAKIDATRDDSIIRLSASGVDAARTGIEVNGDVTAGQVVLNTSGDFGVGERAAVTAKAATTADSAEDAISAIVGGEVAIAGELQAENGTVGVLADGDIVVDGAVYGGEYVVAMANDGDISVNGSVESAVYAEVHADNGSVTVDGAVRAGESAYATTGDGDVTVRGEVRGGNEAVARAESRGNVSVVGTVAAGDSAYVTTGSGDVSIDGVVEGKANTLVESFGGSVTVGGKVASDDMAFVSAKNGSVTVDGTVDGKGAASLDAVNGSVVVNGVVRSDGMPEGMAVLQTAGSGDVVLGRNAEVRGAMGAIVKTENGDLIQQAAPIVDASNRGYAKAETLRPVLAADTVILDVNGDVVGDNGGSVTVDGMLVGIVSGDAKIAIGNGHDLVGGTKQDAARVVESSAGAFSVDLSMLGDNSAMRVGGNLSLYTAGGIGSYTTFEPRENAGISASTFGDTSYLQVGGMLTINNVGRPTYPQIAYFESVDGREPRINNQPNDMVIFVDGRLAGGNLSIINKFGATEAFPVSTPELKSEQGIFGNPVFLHGDLDVANPMAVGNVDYMLQEIPRLTLASDFPLEIDKSVNTAGLNPKDVYRFGQHRQVAEEKPQTEPEEEKDDQASAEESVGSKMAMR